MATGWHGGGGEVLWRLGEVGIFGYNYPNLLFIAHYLMPFLLIKAVQNLSCFFS